jgi:hypothetical protein
VSRFHIYRSPFFYYHIFLASKPRTTQVAGRNKFLPLSSSLSPFPILAWSAGLQAVDQSPSLLVEASKSSKHFGHYAFPDPGLFVSPISDEKKARFVESWLRIREGWLIRLATETSLAMSAQNWRDLLTSDLSTIHEKSDTKAAKRRQQNMVLLTPKSELFPGIKTRSTSGEPMTFQGNKYPPGLLPADHIVRGILWELYQLNFAYELLSLDRRACSKLDTSDDLQLMQRQSLISRCFPINPLLSRSLPDRNCGLAADDIEERLPFVLSLVRVMQSWKGNKPPVFNLAAQSFQEISASQEATGFEEAAAKYYCQQFFNYFGRAALVPHHLFMPTISLTGFM